VAPGMFTCCRGCLMALHRQGELTVVRPFSSAPALRLIYSLSLIVIVVLICLSHLSINASLHQITPIEMHGALLRGRHYVINISTALMIGLGNLDIIILFYALFYKLVLPSFWPRAQPFLEFRRPV